MESSLPALAMPALAAAAAPTADAAPPSGSGAGFRAVLGAVKLTPDQQQALADLLTSVAPLAVTAGNGLPAAAIARLESGCGLPATPAPSDVTAAAEGMPGPMELPAELATLLALLQTAQQQASGASEAPMPPHSPISATQAEVLEGEPAGLAAGLGSLLALLGAPLMPPAGTGGGKAAPGRDGAPTRPPLDAVVSQPREGLQLGHSPGLPESEGDPGGDAAAMLADTTAVPARGASPPAGFLFNLRAAAMQAPEATGVEPSSHAEDLASDLAGAAPVVDARTAAGSLVEPSLVRPRAVETVALPFGDRGWERALGEKVVWLVGQQIQAAEVKLNPPHLGPVEFRLTLNGNEASVSFTAANAAVRDAIEQALPRLREMLAEQNVVVVDVNVGQRGGSGLAEQREGRAQVAGSPAFAPGTDGAPSAETPLRRTSASGLVDEYA